MEKKWITGADIGGTHITVASVDVLTGTLNEASRVRHAIDPSAEAAEVIAAWTAAIRESRERSGVFNKAIGIAMPGPFDYEEGISLIKGLHKYERLYGLNVKTLLSESLGLEAGNIRFINDASAYLLGEMHSGAASGYRNVVGITLGTGLGSAAFYNEQFEEGDLYCTSYREGVCEDYISARWILQQYQDQTGEVLSCVKDLALEARHNGVGRQIFLEFGRNLGDAVCLRYHRQQPQVIVVGGNIAQSWKLFMPAAEQRLADCGMNATFMAARLGEDAALIGGACTWSETI